MSKALKHKRTWARCRWSRVQFVSQNKTSCASQCVCVCVCVCVSPPSFTLTLSLSVEHPPPVCFDLCNRILQWLIHFLSLSLSLCRSSARLRLYLLFLFSLLFVLFFLQTRTTTPVHWYVCVCVCVCVCVYSRCTHTHTGSLLFCKIWSCGMPWSLVSCRLNLSWTKDDNQATEYELLTKVYIQYI